MRGANHNGVYAMNKKSLGLGLTLAAVLLAIAVLPQPAARATADTTPPTGTIVINDNKSCTNSRNVTIAMTWADTGGSGVGRMRFSNDGATWSAYESLTPSKSYTLPVGADGHRTVRVQFIDKANNRSATYSDYILLDRSAPTGGITINKGDSATTTQSVMLGLTYADGTGSGVARMRFSDNGSTWTNWMYPAATKAYQLPKSEFGHQTVRVQYLDGANNYSAVYSDYINLVAPAVGTEETIMLPGNVPLVMKWMPAGTYMMGRYPGEPGASVNEIPQHSVTLGGFWMGKYELTKRQWQAVMGTTPWVGHDYVLDNLDSPAVWVSWDDAQSFLTAANSYTGKTFRLPSEAQWEYACRAGTQFSFYWGECYEAVCIGQTAWYNGNCPFATDYYAHVVGLKMANGWGLYDMSGNVMEWCQDWFYSNYDGAPADGSAWESTPDMCRVLRGGSFNPDYSWCRSAKRCFDTPYSTSVERGFRVVRIP